MSRIFMVHCVYMCCYYNQQTSDRPTDGTTE